MISPFYPQNFPSSRLTIPGNRGKIIITMTIKKEGTPWKRAVAAIYPVEVEDGPAWWACK